MISHRHPRRGRSPRRFSNQSKFVLPSVARLPQIIALLLFLLVSVYVFQSDLLRIKSIDCQLDQKQCTASQLQFLEAYKNRISLFLKPSQISTLLSNSDPSLSHANVTLSFPSKLSATLVTESSPLTLGLSAAIVPTATPTIAPEATASTESSLTPIPHPVISMLDSLPDSADSTITITRLGFQIPNATPTDYKITLVGYGSNPDQKMLTQVYAYQQELSLSAVNYKQGWVTEAGLIIAQANGSYVIFDLSDEPITAIGTLQQIRTEATIKTDRAIIDLRFNKPVISSY